MRLGHLNEADMDVWPAFTDFVTSVLFIVVIFVFGIFFSNIARSLIVEDDALKKMQEKQTLVQRELTAIKGIYVPRSDGNLQRIILQVDKEGKGGVLFDPGRAELKEGGKQILSQIVDVLVKKENRNAYDTIQVEGHTDDRPIHTAQYPSNWELSAARAGAVVSYILEQRQLEPWRFSANGRGQYVPYEVKDEELSLDLATHQDETVRDWQKLPDYVVRHNLDEKAKLNNRRIEIILTYKLAASAPRP